MIPDEPGEWNFRPGLTRPRPRELRRSSAWTWWVVAVISAVLFVLVVRALLERTAWTAGPSPLPVATDGRDPRPPGQGDAASSYVAAPPVPTVYRCVHRAGGVAFQSQPCGAGQRMTRGVPAPPDVEPVRPPRSRQVASDRVVINTYSVAGDDQRAQRRAICALARRNRDAALERIGLNRTYDLLQRLDTNVREACKGL